MGIRVNTGTVGKKTATELLSNKRGEALAYDELAATSDESVTSAGMALTSEELQKFLDSATATAQAPAAVQAEGPAFAVPTPIAGEFRVNTFTTGDQSYSAVTALDGGGFLVTWMSGGQDGGSYGIYGQRYTAAGVADGSEFRINTFTAGGQTYASASALVGGGFVVTWSSNGQDGSGNGIYGQRYTAAGVADGGEFRVNTFTTSGQVFSAVTTLNGGGFVVTWTSNGQDGSTDGIYGQRYTAAGVADGGEFRVNTFTTSGQIFSAVAALDNGGFVVTWTSIGQDGGAEGVYAQRYTSAGVADGSEFRVNTFTTGLQAYSSVTGLDGGGFVVTWSSDGQDGSNFGVYGQRYTAAGVADGGEFRINTFTNSTQFFPSVTALNGGGFLVTWSSIGQDGDSYGVYGQRYDAAGVADGAEFRVNETTVGLQYNDVVPHQSVTQLADGSLITTWTGNGIGDTGGVFARQFAISSPGALSINDVAQSEGNAGTTNFSFTVTRSGGSDGAVGATWTLTLSGAATAGDFTAFPQTGTVSFAAGETSQTVTITVQGDFNNEADETFTVVLSAPTGGATITDGTGLGTITNDDPVINGTAGPDSLSGTIGDDVINGLAGNDTINGQSGNDTINGGEDNDFIGGQAGNDTLNGDAGIDRIDGGADNDIISGGLDHDRVIGGAGDDTLDGGDGDDLLNGDTTSAGGTGNDILNGGAGVDRAAFYTTTGGVGATVDLNIVGVAQNTGQGMDTLTGIENLSGTVFADMLIGDGGDNWLWGSTANFGGTTSATNNDTINGNGGNDLIEVGIGNHVVDGGADNDTFRFTENFTVTDPGISVSLLLQGSAQASGSGNWTLSNFENLSGGQGNDTLTGDGNANRITGERGDDTIFGGGGDDTLSGDLLYIVDTHGIGYSGQATLMLATDDVVAEATGNDTIDGGAGDDTVLYRFLAGAGTLTIVADGLDYLVKRDGVDVARVSRAGSTVTVTGLGDGAHIGTDTLTNVDHISFAIEGAAAVVLDIPANTAATGTDGSIFVYEDTPLAFNDPVYFGYNDADGDAFGGVWIDSVTGGGALTFNGAAITAPVFITAAQITASALLFTPALNANSNNYAAFTFRVTDTLGGTDPVANTRTIAIDPINDAPVITNLQGDVSTQTEGAGGTTFADAGRNAVITDVDSANFDGGQLVVAITAGFQTNDAIYIFGDGVTAVGAGNVVTVNGIAVGVVSGGSGVSPSSPTLTIDLNSNATVALVQTLLRGIFVRDPFAEPRGGTRDITVTVRDGDGGQNSYTSQLVVNAVNDEPSGTDATITINEDAARALTAANFGFLDTTTPFNFGEGNSLAAVFITTLPTAGTLYIDTDGAGTGALGTAVTAGQRVTVAEINAGQLVYVPVANANGIGHASFTFQVQDNGGTTNGGIDTDQSPNTLTFNVTAVNDAPVSSGFDTITFVEDNPNAVPLDTGFDQILVDVDSPNFDGGTLTFRVSGGHVPTEDRLTFLPGGTSFLTVSGNVISYQGVAFATFSPAGLGLTRTFTFNANATVEAVQTLMRNLAYRNDNQDNPSTAQRTIEYILTDGDGGSQTLTSVVNVTAVNDAPAVDLNGTATGIDNAISYLEGTSAPGNGFSIVITDDSGTLTRATVTITDAAAGDELTLSLPLPTGISVDPASTATTLILVGTASTSAFVTALGQVGFRSTSDDPTAGGADTTRSITVVVNDGVADSAPATMTLTVVAVNDAPVVTITPTPFAPAFDQFTLNTTNGWNISGFVQAENFTLGNATTLNHLNVYLLDTGNGTATFDGFSGTLSFAIYANDGSGQPGTLLFTGADLAPLPIDTGVDAFGRDVFQFAVNLGGIALPAGNYWFALHEGAWLSPSDGSELFWMLSANDVTGIVHVSTGNETAPSGTYTAQPGGLSFSLNAPTEQVPYNLKGLITVADVDAGSGVITATLSVGYGVINITAGTSGATIDSGNGTGSVVVSGTLAQLNALLNTDSTSVVTFTANTDTPPANTAFSVSVNDNVNTGSGGAQTGMASQTIVITAINDVPVADLNGTDAGINTTGSYTEGDAAIKPIAGIVLSDTDNANLTGATVRIATGFVAGDMLRLSGGLSGTTASGITFSYNSGTGVLTLTGSATVSDYQAALATLAFKTINDTPGTARGITVVVNDGAVASLAARINLTVVPTNDAPVVDLNGSAAGINATGSYTEGDAAILPVPGITLNDVDSGNLTGATVTIGTGFVAGDILRLSGGLSGTTSSGIAFSYDNGTGVLTLSGSASVADYQAALATLKFKSNSDDPGIARDITVVVNDGAARSVAAHINLTISPVNDAPVNIVPGEQTTTSGDIIVFSAANGNALSVSDADAGSGTIRIRLSADHGTLTFSSTTGVTVIGNGTGVVKLIGTLSAINAALDGLTYQGEAGYVGADALTITTNDLDNSGGGGPLTDTDSVAITVNGDISQEPLSDKLFADDQSSNISAAFVVSDNKTSGHDGIESLFYPFDHGHDLILGSAFLV